MCIYSPLVSYLVEITQNLTQNTTCALYIHNSRLEQNLQDTQPIHVCVCASREGKIIKGWGR